LSHGIFEKGQNFLKKPPGSSDKSSGEGANQSIHVAQLPSIQPEIAILRPFGESANVSVHPCQRQFSQSRVNVVTEGEREIKFLQKASDFVSHPDPHRGP
jgi:hypothetical protein